MCWHNLADFLYGARQRDNFSLLKGLSLNRTDQRSGPNCNHWYNMIVFKTASKTFRF